jgi:glycosyltransferase involved in cell wall biosynthesis
MEGRNPHGPMIDGMVSLVIPAHNEALNMEAVMRDVRTTLDESHLDYEIILVDDGSTDGTADAAGRALGTGRVHLRVVRHDRQCGYAATICDGLRAARGDVLAFMDGDGQFRAADLRILIDALTGADLVAGYRRIRADPWPRLVMGGTLNVLVRLLYGVHVRDVDCGLKVMRREVFEASCPILARSALFNTELYFKAQRCGYTVRQIGVEHHARRAGRRSGGRLIPVLRAVRDIIRLRGRLLRAWSPPRPPVRVSREQPAAHGVEIKEPPT